jgi:hypothetical protein|eukprot:COSAG01_NODE_176_length_22957_cov_72.262096_9_plen_112_part_00
MPTLLELCGLVIRDAAELEGVSLVPLLQLPPTPHSSRRQQLPPATAETWKNATFTVYPRCCGPHGWHGGCNATNAFDTSNQCTQTPSDLFYAMGYSIRSRDWRCASILALS